LLYDLSENVQTLNQLQLTEASFQKNLRFVTGSDCPFLGKLLYLYFSNNINSCHISLARFFDGLRPFCQEEDKSIYNRCAFSILDIDRDGELNVFNLIYLFRNLPAKTKLAQEIFSLLEYYIVANLRRESLLQRVKVDLDCYLKINSDKMSLV
jgi:hypothetical protein